MTWTVTECIEKKLDGNRTRMLQVILNKSCMQQPTKRQLYGHLCPIFKTIKIRWTKHAGHCWRSEDELISDVLLQTPSHGHASVDRPIKSYLQQLCMDIGCSLEDLLETMDDRDEWRERVREIRASSKAWWYMYIYIYIYITKRRQHEKSNWHLSLLG